MTTECEATCRAKYFHGHYGEGHVIEPDLMCADDPGHEGEKHFARCQCGAKLTWTDEQVRLRRRQANRDRLITVSFVAVMVLPTAILGPLSGKPYIPELLFMMGLVAPVVVTKSKLPPVTQVNLCVLAAVLMAVSSVWQVLLEGLWNLVGLPAAGILVWTAVVLRRSIAKARRDDLPEQIP